jgi:HEAT repeat protein
MKRTILVAAGVFIWATAQTADAQQKDAEMQTVPANATVNGRTLAEWEADLTSVDPSVRIDAMTALKLYGSGARKTAAKIIRFLEDPDVAVRAHAIGTLVYVGVEQKDIRLLVAGLDKRLIDPEAIIRFYAARALGRVGREAYAALHRLRLLTKDHGSSEIRGAAAYALGYIGYEPGSRGKPDRASQLALIDLLNDKSSQVRVEALYSLIMMGVPNIEDRRRELDTLASLCTAKQPDKVQIWAHVAIMRIESVSEQHLIVIAKFLKSRKLDTRIHAARAFATIGPEAKSYLDPLVDALEDKEPTMLVWVCSALAQMGEEAQKNKRVIPVLQKLLGHSEESVRRAAKDAIDAIMEKRKKE